MLKAEWNKNKTCKALKKYKGSGKDSTITAIRVDCDWFEPFKDESAYGWLSVPERTRMRNRKQRRNDI